jgi:uncharacterized protein
MTRHVPFRTCVICRQKREKRSLYRVVLTEQGLGVDQTGKLEGRGVYLCEDNACWERAIESKSLDRALRVTLTDEQRQAIRRFAP